jgi:hypothetical protein
MNPRAIIASLPLLRRVWRRLPGPLRVPVLVIAVIIGTWYVVTGRHKKASGEDTSPAELEEVTGSSGPRS